MAVASHASLTRLGCAEPRVRSRATRRWVALAGVLACLAASALGCNGNGNGTPCTTDLDCQSSFVCVADPALPSARCMRLCEAGTRLCADGSVCLDLAGGRACFPGGRVGFGEPCTASLDCEAGTVCPDAVRSCQQACGPSLMVCAATQPCVDDATVGPYCTP
ncbi:MAG: hypothetical protein K1X94_10560 [Sandaracinaceae bacterium]|nr:hypothetical protein [Sandaracinaceae bacterium]